MPVSEENEQPTPLRAGITSSHQNDEEQPLLNSTHNFQYVPNNTSLQEYDSVPQGRYLDLKSTTLLFLCRIIGSGIFATPGGIFRDVDSSPLAFLLVWVIAALVAISGLSVYLELGSLIPRSGATKVFLEYIYYKPKLFASVTFSIFQVLFDISSTNAIVFGEYSLHALGYPPNEDISRRIGVGLIGAAVLFHSISVKFGVRVQNCFGILKTCLLIIILATGFYVTLLPRSLTGIKNQLTKKSLTKLPTNASPSLIASATLRAIHSFGGWTTAHTVQNEIKDPIRTLRLAGPASLLIVIISYMTLNLSYLIVIPHDQIAHGGQLVGSILFEKLLGNELGNRFLTFSIAVCAAGNVIQVAYSVSRMNQEIAREGILPFSKFWASNYPFGAPFAALLLHFIFSSFIILVVPRGDVYNYIVSMQIYPNQLFHVLLCVGIFILRRRYPSIKAPIRAWTVVVLFCLVASSLIVLAPFLPQNSQNDKNGYPSYAVGGLSVLAFGMLYWFIFVEFLPWLQSSHVERVPEMLEDGLVVKRWVKVVN